ncbi:unnamed protein product [Adineta ricciae]|uniref:Uncharacterized protein n=1 Tax=Adineta ricciae TaxID=249248 RepID=A0A813TMA8_ADIRI|nr:unnamed protein product [Adineta ricciae]
MGGSNCQIKLNSNSRAPRQKDLFETCKVVNSSSCSVYMKMDFNDQQIYLSFQHPSPTTGSPHSYPNDLLADNPQSSIIRRYTATFHVRDQNRTQLYIWLQCRYRDYCAHVELRTFWGRYVSFDDRYNTLSVLYEFLQPVRSTSINCFDNEFNETVECPTHQKTCWASSDGSQKCVENYSDEFIYSYNQVYNPHRLSNENVLYTLTCHSNSCNDNQTIDELSALAREFAENRWSLERKSTVQNSTGIRLCISSYQILCFCLVVLCKHTFPKVHDHL